MSLILEAGEVAFANSAGTKRWSSNDKNLVLTNVISNSFVINNKTTTGAAIIQTETKNLGAVASNASIIWGNYIDSGRVAAIGGDRIAFASRENMINASSYQYNLSGASMFAKCVWYRLDITGGNLVASVFYRFPAGSSPNFTSGRTVQVRALIGGFEF